MKRILKRTAISQKHDKSSFIVAINLHTWRTHWKSAYWTICICFVIKKKGCIKLSLVATSYVILLFFFKIITVSIKFHIFLSSQSLEFSSLTFKQAIESDTSSKTYIASISQFPHNKINLINATVVCPSCIQKQILILL